jgi:hypothetical protein
MPCAPETLKNDNVGSISRLAKPVNPLPGSECLRFNLGRQNGRLIVVE